MSTAAEGSSDLGRTCKKTDKGRRIWTSKEEEILLAAMKDIVANGWKSDNGFRAGYLNKLESAMKKVFPNTDLKGTPHINSKLSSWKKNYYSLTQILGKSGMGWNTHGDFMFDCTNEQWDQIVKLDNNAKTMRNKSWPLYYEWQEIFGKDRANGENAIDIQDACFGFFREGDIREEGNAGDYHVNLENLDSHADASESVSQHSKKTESPKRRSRKRKERDDNSRLCDVLEEMGRSTNERLDYLASRIGYDCDLGKARKDSFELLCNISGLSLDERLDVCAHLIERVERLEMFTGLPEEAKTRYVMRFLSHTAP